MGNETPKAVPDPIEDYDALRSELEAEKAGLGQKFSDQFLNDYRISNPQAFAALQDALADDENGFGPSKELALRDLDVALDNYNEKVIFNAEHEDTPQAFEEYLDNNWLPKFEVVKSQVEKRLTQDPTVSPLQYPDQHNGRNGYDFKLNYLDNGQVQVSIDGPTGASPVVKELYGVYVHGLSQLLQKIPHYESTQRPAQTDEACDGLTITVGLPKIVKGDDITALKTAGYLVTADDGLLYPRDGYMFVDEDPNTTRNFAVKRIEEEVPVPAEPAKAKVDVAAVRAEAKDKTEYVTGDKTTHFTFNVVKGSNADKYVRIEDLYTTEAERALTLTSDHKGPFRTNGPDVDLTGKEFKYDPARDSFYEWKEGAFGAQRLAMVAGDTITNKVEEPKVVEVPKPTEAVKTSVDQDAAAKKEVELATSTVGSIHTLRVFANARVRALEGVKDTTPAKTRERYPDEWKAVDEAYIGIRDLYASVDVSKAPVGTPYLDEILTLRDAMPVMLASLGVKDAQGKAVTMAAPQAAEVTT